MRWLDSITDSMDLNLNELGRYWKTEEPGVLQSMGSQRVGYVSDWKTNTLFQSQHATTLKKKSFPASRWN